ncbi:hypothetical protein [Longitalea arenae]|uniref:hypothetical protein n=1 Tax=Longitalea arenae TaxID=2812558 RepID=UPI001967CBCD|nr:hypothetical protein [Longitalea arenae]
MRGMLHTKKSWLLSTLILLTHTAFARFAEGGAARSNGSTNGINAARSQLVDKDSNMYVTGSATAI